MAIEKLNLRADSQDERFAQLKQLYPEIFSDGNLNVEALKEACGLETEEDGYYGLYWPGKNEAKKLARKEATGTLEPVEGDGVNEETTHNIYIEGDNLEVLRTLKKSYQNRVKMIYIDPPYNTGNDFIYPDNYQEPVDDYLRFTGQMDDKGNMLVANPKSSGKFHRRWLSMIYPRLLLAKELLSNDGAIFISIDDNEQSNMKILCDEIFGESNFIACLVWEKKKKGAFLSKDFINMKEYILVYAKNDSYFKGLVGEINTDTETYPCIKTTNARGIRVIKKGTPSKYKKQNYEIKAGTRISSGNMELIYLDKLIVKNSVLQEDVRIDSNWIYGQDALNEFADKKLLYITQDNYIRRIVEDDRTKMLKDLLLRVGIDNKSESKFIYDVNMNNHGWGTNEDANDELHELLGQQYLFDFPKPSKLISKLIQSIDNKEMIVMDFFSGSATTAQSIIQLNAADKGNRKYICVQLPIDLSDKEKVKEYLESINKPINLCELAKQRIRCASKAIVEENSMFKDTLDSGFKVYRLAKSNFTVFENINGTDKSALDNLFAAAEKDPLTEGWKERKSSVVAELCLRHGFVLDSQITKCPEYKKNEVLKIVDQNEEKTMFVCLDEKISEETAKTLHLEDGEKFICLDSAIGDQLKVQLADKGRIETI